MVRWSGEGQISNDVCQELDFGGGWTSKTSEQQSICSQPHFQDGMNQEQARVKLRGQIATEQEKLLGDREDSKTL